MDYIALVVGTCILVLPLGQGVPFEEFAFVESVEVGGEDVEEVIVRGEVVERASLPLPPPPPLAVTVFAYCGSIPF
jgi:hypothetical protein